MKWKSRMAALEVSLSTMVEHSIVSFEDGACGCRHCNREWGSEEEIEDDDHDVGCPVVAAAIALRDK